MYQALYRKYRPSTFEDVIGQDVIVKTLKNEISNNHISHAYLFTGPRGTGKTSIAKILAKTVNCEHLNGFQPCEVCVSCTQINNRQTTDIIEIDAASNNGVDEIRELKSKVNLVPSTSKYKVYIIDEVHMLTTGAFNALLKTLEEPPSHIIFILATTDPHKIPSTILSRCQRFDFKRISDKKIVERLKYIVKKEKIDIEEDALYEIARLSDGGMRDSISMLDQVLAFSESTITVKEVHEVNGTLSQYEMQSFMEDLSQNNIQNILNKIDEWDESGKNFVKITEEIILFLKNMVLFQKVPDYLKESRGTLEPYSSMKNIPSTEVLLKNIDLFYQSLDKLKRSSNSKLMLELTILSLTNYEKKELPKTIEKATKEEKVEEQIEPKKQVEKQVIHKKQIKVGQEKEFQNLIVMRINNALAGFSRKEVMEFKKKEDLLHNYLLDSDKSKYVSLIFDGTLKAVGNHTLIYVFSNESISNLFNESIPKIDEIISLAFEEPFHAVSTYAEKWDEIKNDFNNKKKSYQYIEEQIDLNSIFESSEKKESDEMQNLFGEIVEYQ